MKLGKNLKDKRVLVLGASRSGLGAKAFLENKGASVVVYDDRNPIEVDESFDLCVISPGISIDHPLAVQFADVLISELELGLSQKTKQVIAVTGTNGKTSVVNMLHQAICPSVLCGNIGTPTTTVDLQKKRAVVEVSSFMLESAKTFKPKIAVILNISQDHLERHKTMEEYIACKAAITKNQTKRDILVLNYDDQTVRNIKTNAKKLYFSTTSRVRGIYIENGIIILNIGRRAKELFYMPYSTKHEIENFLATVLVAKIVGVSDKRLMNLKPPGEHRIEFVASHGNLAFFNDSKATNIASCLAACNSLNGQIHLLVGGVSKGQDFNSLFEKIPDTVSHVFAFGACSDDIMDAAGRLEFTRITKFETLEQAFTASIKHGVGQRLILLSPAAASFDQFQNYEHRGNEFKKMVGEYAKSK